MAAQADEPVINLKTKGARTRNSVIGAGPSTNSDRNAVCQCEVGRHDAQDVHRPVGESRCLFRASGTIDVLQARKGQRSVALRNRRYASQPCTSYLSGGWSSEAKAVETPL